MKEDYPLFVKWMETLDWILDRVESFPKSVRYSFSNRIAAYAIDLMEGIIEAIYTKNRSHILKRLNLYIEKLRVFFRIAFKRKYISISQYEYISCELDESGRMVGGWMKVK